MADIMLGQLLHRPTIDPISDSSPLPVQLSGRKASLRVTSLTETLNVAASGTYTVTVTPPAGELWRLQHVYVKLAAPTGATTGTHRLALRRGVNIASGQVSYGQSKYDGELSYDGSFIGKATHSKYPSLETVQQAAILSIAATAAIPLFIFYSNITDVAQTNSMTVYAVWGVETIV